jgi:acetyl-CoA acetyltransferase
VPRNWAVSAISASIVDAGARASDVDEVLMGCVLPAGQGQAPARQAGFLAGLAKMCLPPRSTRCAARA